MRLSYLSQEYPPPFHPLINLLANATQLAMQCRPILSQYAIINANYPYSLSVATSKTIQRAPDSLEYNFPSWLSVHSASPSSSLFFSSFDLQASNLPPPFFLSPFFPPFSHRRRCRSGIVCLVAVETPDEDPKSAFSFAHQHQQQQQQKQYQQQQSPPPKHKPFKRGGKFPK